MAGVKEGACPVMLPLCIKGCNDLRREDARIRDRVRNRIASEMQMCDTPGPIIVNNSQCKSPLINLTPVDNQARGAIKGGGDDDDEPQGRSAISAARGSSLAELDTLSTSLAELNSFLLATDWDTLSDASPACMIKKKECDATKHTLKATLTDNSQRCTREWADYMACKSKANNVETEKDLNKVKDFREPDDPLKPDDDDSLLELGVRQRSLSPDLVQAARELVDALERHVTDTRTW